jgi:hypothetical protein
MYHGALEVDMTYEIEEQQLHRLAVITNRELSYSLLLAGLAGPNF